MVFWLEKIKINLWWFPHKNEIIITKTTPEIRLIKDFNNHQNANVLCLFVYINN